MDLDEIEEYIVTVDPNFDDGSLNIKIDVLSRPYLKRYDSGLNHVLSKESVKNNVAIELCFKDILKSYLSHRSKIISNFRDIYVLHRKFDFPLSLFRY